MKHVLYALLLCALFQGCGSSKSVREKTDRRIMSDSLVEIKGNFERREGEIRTDSAGYIRQARQDRIVVMFDTGKPVSSQTGLPPVKQISFTGTALHEESGSTAAVYSFQSRRADSCYAHTGKRKTGKSSGAIGRQHPGHCSGESLCRPA